MESVLAEHHKQAAQNCLLLRNLRSEADRLDWSHERLREAEEKTLKKLEELCVREILCAVLSNWVAAGLCGVYVGSVQKGRYSVIYLLRKDIGIIHTAIRRAASSVAASGKRFHEHVKACVAQIIVEESSAAITEIRQLKTRALLKLLEVTTIDRVRFIITYLTEEQRRGLSRSLYRELGDDPRLLPMDREPKLPAQPTLKQRYAWLHWCLWSQSMHSQDMRGRLGGVPRIIAVADGDAMLINKSTGLPADPLGAIHAPVWRVLGRELNKTGHPIKDPESERRIANSIGISRDKLRSLPKLPVKIKTNGGGRVDYTFTDDDCLESLKAMSRKKPKRKEH
jgi:hypothetical protein